MEQGIISSGKYSKGWLTAIRTISVIWLIFGFALFYLAISMSFEESLTGDEQALQWIMGIFGSIYLISGTGLLLKKSWGKVMGIITAVLSLPAIPVGTVFGVLVLIGLNRNTSVYSAEKY